MSCCKKSNGGCQNSQNIDQTLTTLDHLVCTCMGVMYSEIIQAIDAGATSFEELSDKLGVGTGCSSCVQEVHEILSNRSRPGCCKS
ncbi:MAG TPA: (2Fe-2S)-binding protein [Candidatus Saccharimonadales bacterium]|nr:(2Fe-2S)-binding protein [Candidatus Saccharimonadales bacterium]